MSWVESCLSAAGDLEVVVFGDFCLDAYWHLADKDREFSIETGLPVWRVGQQRWCPGGAGNVAANLVSLGVREVRALGLVGNDAFGRELQRELDDLSVDTSALLIRRDFQTLVYAKPLEDGREQNRIDFGAFSVASGEAIDSLANELDREAARADVVLLNQQVADGVSSPAMIERINDVITAHPGCLFVVDSRHRSELYTSAVMKLNEREAARLCGWSDESEPVPMKVLSDLARAIRDRTQHDVFLTAGNRGVLAADEARVIHEPAIPVADATDAVGAGDTVLAALAVALGYGLEAERAARLANLAASFTLQKLNATGQVTPDEILELARERRL